MLQTQIELPAGFSKAAAIAERHPEITRKLLKAWARSCPFLDHPIRSMPHPTNQRAKLYSDDDASKVAKTIKGLTFIDPPFPTHYTDAAREQWIWLECLGKDAEKSHAIAQEKRYRVAPDSIRTWESKGCGAIEGKKLRVKTLWTKTPLLSRKYISMTDLDLIKAFRISSQPLEQFWLRLKEAQRIVPRGLIVSCSNNGGPRQKLPGKPHPALKRLIKTESRTSSAGGRIVKHTVFWRPDLEWIATYRPPAHAWASRHDALKEYPPVKIGHLVNAERKGESEMKTAIFSLPPRASRPTASKHYYRDHLAKLQKRLTDRSRHDPEKPRVHLDSEGQRWLPWRELSSMLGKPNLRVTEWRTSCPHLGGRPLRAKQVAQFLAAHWRQTVWVYLEEDVINIKRHIDGLPALVVKAHDDLHTHVILTKMDEGFSGLHHGQRRMHRDVKSIGGQVTAINGKADKISGDVTSLYPLFDGLKASPQTNTDDFLTPGEAIAQLRLGDVGEGKRRKIFAKLVATMPEADKTKDGRITKVRRTAWKAMYEALKAGSKSSTDWSDAVDNDPAREARKLAERAKKLPMPG